MTTAKKRNKKSAAAAAAATTTTPVVESASPVWFEEGMDELLIDHGKHIDFERLVKYMPNIVEQLKDGAVSVDQFAKEVLCNFTKQYNTRNAHMSFESIVLSICTSFCKPGPPLICAADTTESMFLKKLADGILYWFFLEYDDFKDFPDGAFSEAAVLALQWSFEKTCRTFSAQMDQMYFNGETGAFLRWCPLYGVLSAKKFADAIDAFDLRKQLILARNAMIEDGRVQKAARNAALAVVHNFDEPWVKCWECGSKGQKLPRCCRCSVAQYCNQDCQRKAWRRHKAVCSTNKKLHGFHLESLRIVNEAHETETRYGVDLNLKIDHSTTRYVMGAVLHPEYFGLPAAGPSMEYFYQNLEQILRGDWWVWSETCSLSQFMEKCSSSFHGDHFEAVMGAVRQVCLLLSFDLHGYAAAKNNGIVTSKSIEAIVNQHPYAMKNKGMPVAFFLKIYLDYNDDEDDLPTRQRLLNVIKADGLALLMQNELDA